MVISSDVKQGGIPTSLGVAGLTDFVVCVPDVLGDMDTEIGKYYKISELPPHFMDALREIDENIPDHLFCTRYHLAE